MKDTWEYDGTKIAPKDVRVVVVKNGVTSICADAFKDCSRLISIEVPKSVTEINERAFMNCESLKSLDFLHLTLLTSIEPSAFYNCTSLTSIQFPSSLQMIGEYAFYNCSSFRTLKLPPSLNYLGDQCFRDCPLTSISLPHSIYYFTNSFEISSLTSILFYSSPKHRKPSDADFILLYVVIKNCPSAAKRPCTDDGVLPLHFAAIHGFAHMRPEIKTILDAAPDTLSIRDQMYHLYPFLLAACAPSYRIPEKYIFYSEAERQLNDLNGIYMLLREAPFVMCFLVNDMKTVLEK